MMGLLLLLLLLLLLDLLLGPPLLPRRLRRRLTVSPIIRSSVLRLVLYSHGGMIPKRLLTLRRRIDRLPQHWLEIWC